MDKETDKSILTNEIREKLGTSVDIEQITKKRPKLKIIGVTKEIIEMAEKTLISSIIKQNKLLNFDAEKDCKIIKRFLKNHENGSIILEVHQDIHKLLLEIGKIKIGWTSYKIYNFIDVNRCFNCWGYNHKAGKCRRSVVCRKCAGQHKESDCQNNWKKCNNCVNWAKKFNLTDWDVDHEVTNVNCKFYIKMLNSEASKIIHSSCKN